MSDLLGIGLSGLTAYRSALATVGENVANAETPGFARRTIRLSAQNVGGGTDIQNREDFRFGGVGAVSVTRAWDVFRAAEARHANAGAGRGSVREQWLSRIETSLDDGSAGVGGRLTAFFNAADTLAAAPGDTLNRNRMLLAIEDVAGAFRTTGTSLARIAGATGEAAALDTRQLNQTMTALADTNRSLLTAPQGGTSRAALEDERDRLIDAISADIDVVVSYGDNGAATLRLADAPGTTIVEPANTGQFALAAAADGRLSLSVTTNAGTVAIVPASGKLAGYVDVANVIADRRAALDTLAADFAGQLNAWSAAGRDANGNAGTALLDASGGAAAMASLVTDPALVPAAAPGGAPNGNLLALAAFRGSNGAERRWTNIVAGHAQQLAAAKSEAAAAATLRENAFAVLDETTGIDLDREAGDLLRYQQAYSASARIIQVSREIFDDLLRAT